MNIRKIAVMGSFAAGAALALAPLAAADPVVDPLAPFVASEIASLNSMFVSDADLAGVGTDVVTHPGDFDTIPLADAPKVPPFTPLDYELYGINPAVAGPASDPGAYNVDNGALTEFYNAYNVELFSLLNPTAPIDTIPMADLFGSASGISEALATGSAFGAAGDFFADGMNDLLGYFSLPPLFDLPAL
ncbi:MAG: hypothetical protein WB785_21380 [Mycobacterium sp.]|uniref:hypothetical protein n=1 Tax=Mycobacterium sp. TaxID=1785 RepID=UPI003C5E6270